MSVRLKIKKLRENKKQSQEELAFKLGISTGALSKIENEAIKKIDFLLMDKICTEFNVYFSYFLNLQKLIR